MPERTLLDDLIENKKKGVGFETPNSEYVTNVFEPTRLDSNLYKEGKEQGVDFSNVHNNLELMDAVADKQSSGEKWLNDFGRLGMGALSATAGGFAMIPAFFDAAGSGDLSAMYENGAVKWAEGLNEWGQENFKNYYTKRQEEAYREASIFEKMAYGEKFWGGTLLANAGFMIGAAIDEAIFAAAGTALAPFTGGASEALPLATASWFGARLARRLAEAGTEVMGSGSNLVKNVYRGFTAEGEVAKQAMLSGIKNSRQLLTSAGYESSVEALQFQKEAYQGALARKAEELNVSIEELENNPAYEKTLGELKSGINRVTNGLWLMNLATVGSSNAIGATALFQLEKPILNMLDGINPLKKFISSGVDDVAKGATQFAAKELNVAQKAFNILKSPLAEGVEEFSQGLYKSVGDKYLEDKYNPSAIDMLLTGLPIMAEQIGKRLGDSSHEGWEEFASGFITSLLGLPNVGRFVGKKEDGTYGFRNDKTQPIIAGGIFQGIAENRQYAENTKNLAAENNALNDEYLNNVMKNKLSSDNITTVSAKAFPMIQAAQLRLAKAIEDNDVYAQNQAKHDLLAYAAIARDKIDQGENFKNDVLAQYDEHKKILTSYKDSTVQEERDMYDNVANIYEGNNLNEKLSEVDRKKKSTEKKLKDVQAGIKLAKGLNLSPELQDRMAVVLSNGNNRVSEANILLKNLQKELNLPTIGDLSVPELYDLLDKHKIAKSTHKKLSKSLEEDKALYDTLPDEVVTFEGETPRANEKKKATKERIDNWQKELDKETERLTKELNKKSTEIDWASESPLAKYEEAIDKLAGAQKASANSLLEDVQKAINEHKESVKEYNRIMQNPEAIIKEENDMRVDVARKMTGIVVKNETSSKLPDNNTSNNKHSLVGKETTEGAITNVINYTTEEGTAILVDTEKVKGINLANVAFTDSELKGLMEEYIKQEKALLPASEILEKKISSITDKDVAEAFKPFLTQLQNTVKRRKQGIKAKLDNFSTLPTKLSPIESDSFKEEMSNLIKKSVHKRDEIDFAPLNTRTEVPKNLQIIDVGDYETKGDGSKNEFGKELPGTSMFSKIGVKGRVKLAVTIQGDKMMVYGIVPNVASYSFNFTENDQTFENVTVATIQEIEGKKTVVLTPEFIKVLNFVYGKAGEQKKSFVAWNDVIGYESKSHQYGDNTETLSLEAIAQKYKPNQGEPVVFWNIDKIEAIYLDGKLLSEKEIDKWKKDNNIKRPTSKDEKAIVLYNGKPGKQKAKTQMDGTTPRKYSWNTMGINEEFDFKAIEEAQKQLVGAKTEKISARVIDKNATPKNIELDPDNAYKTIEEFRMKSPLKHGDGFFFLRIGTNVGSAWIQWQVTEGKAKLIFNRTLDGLEKPGVDLSKIAHEQKIVEEDKFFEWLATAKPEEIRNMIERFLQTKNTKTLSVYTEDNETYNKFENRLTRGGITAYTPNIQWVAKTSTKIDVKDIEGIELVAKDKRIKITYRTGNFFIGTVVEYNGKAITFGKKKIVDGEEIIEKIGTPVILQQLADEGGVISIPTAEDEKKVTPSNVADLVKATTFISIKKELVDFLKRAENKEAIVTWMTNLKNRATFKDLSKENLDEIRALCSDRIAKFEGSSQINIIQTKGDEILKELEKLKTVEEKLEWLKNNNLISPITINGKQYNAIDYSDRVMVMAKMGKYNIPFYISTGSAGKKTVKPGDWFVVFGIGEQGWINKGDEASINAQYNVPYFQKMAAILNKGIGRIESREDNGNGKLKDFIGFLQNDKKSLDEFNKQMNLPTNTTFENNDKKKINVELIPAKSHTDQHFWDYASGVIHVMNEELKNLYGVKEETDLERKKRVEKTYQDDLNREALEQFIVNQYNNWVKGEAIVGLNKSQETLILNALKGIKVNGKTPRGTISVANFILALPNLPPFKIANPSQTIEFEEALNNLKTIAPDWMKIQLADEDMLRNIAANLGGLRSEQIMGWFDGIINLRQSSNIGTEYHELFHGIFNMVVDDKTKKKLIDEALNKYPIDYKEVDMLMKRDKISKGQAIKVFLEEKMADEFMGFMKNKKKYEKKSFLGRVFEWLKNLIFGNLGEIHNVFNKIANGKFKTAQKVNSEFDSVRTLVIKYNEFNEQTDTYIQRILPAEDAYNILNTLSRYIAFDKMNFEDAYQKVMELFDPNNYESDLDAVSDEEYEKITGRLATIYSVLERRENIEEVKKEVEQRIALYGLEIEDDGTIFSVENEEKENSWAKSILEMGGFLQTSGKWRQMLAFTTYTSFEYGVRMTLPVDIVMVNNHLELISQNLKKQDIFERLEKITQKDSPMVYQAFQNIKENISKEIDLPINQLTHETMWGKSMIYSILTDQLHKTNSNPIDTMIYKNITAKDSVVHANAKSAGKAQVDKWVIKYNEVKDTFKLPEKFFAFQREVFTEIKKLFEELEINDEVVYAIQQKLESLGIVVTTAYIRECLEYNKRVIELTGLTKENLQNLTYENGLFIISNEKQHDSLTDVIEFINGFITDEKQKLASTLSADDVYKKVNSVFFYKNKWQTLKDEFPSVVGRDIYHNMIYTGYVAPMFKKDYNVFSIVSKNVKDLFEDSFGKLALRGNLTKLANGNAAFDESVRKPSYKTMDNKTVYETIHNNYVKEMERALSNSEFREFLIAIKGREITQDDIDKFTEFLSLPNDVQTEFINKRMLAWLQNSPLIDFIDNDFEVNFLGGFKEVKTSSSGESADSKKNLGMAFDEASVADSFKVGFINWKEKNLIRPIILSGKSTQLAFKTNRKLKDESLDTVSLTRIEDNRPVVTDKAVNLFKSLLEQELERIKWVRNLSEDEKTKYDDEIEGYIKKGSTFSQNTGFAKYLKENSMKDILKKLEQANNLNEVENIDEIIANYMNNHLIKSYEFLQGIKTSDGYVKGKIQSTDDFFYKKEPIIQNGVLSFVEFAEYEIDSWLKSEILYQFIAFDKAMGLEGVIDTFKRSGSIIASGSTSIGSLNHVTIDDKSLAHFIGVEEAQEDSDFIKENTKRYWDDMGGEEGFEEAYQAALKGKTHEKLPPTLGAKVDRYDADSVATIEVLIDHILVPQGKYNKEVRAIYDKIKVGMPLSYEEYEYLRLNNALNQKRKMSYVQGLFYKKTSTQFIGIEEFAFIKPSIAEREDVLEYLLSEYQKVTEGDLTYANFINKNYNIRIGKERMFNVMSAMYGAKTQYLFFKTSSKQLKRNLIKPNNYKDVYTKITPDRNSTINAEYLREQMKTDGVKSEITHGTQLMQLVWSEQNPNTILYTTKGEKGTVITAKTLKEEYLQLLASRINFIKEKIKKEAGYDGSTLDTEVLKKIFGESIVKNGGQNYLYEFVTEVDWNIPHTNEKIQNMFFSYLSKSLSQKREGTALAMQSDFIYQIVRAKEDIIIDGQTLLKGEVIPNSILEKYYDDLKDSNDIFVGRLRHGIWNGEFFYGEAIIPNIHKALENGIPEAFQYAFKIRIPTQDKHSMMAVRFVDVMPGYKGATIVLPLETIFLAGEDFDIDKAYMYWSAVYKNKQGQWKSYGDYTNINDAWTEYKAIMKDEYKADAKSDYVPLTLDTFFENIEEYITVDKEKQERYDRIFDKFEKEIELWEQVNDIMDKAILVTDKESSKQKISSVLRNPDFEMSESLKADIEELIEDFEDEKLFIYLKKIGQAYSKESFRYKIGSVAQGVHERMEQNKVGYRGKNRKYNSKKELNNDLLYCELRLIHNKGNQNISLSPAVMDSQTDLIYNEVLLDHDLNGTALRQFMEAEGLDQTKIEEAIDKYIRMKGFAVRDTNHAPTDILKAENMEAIGEDNIGIGAKFSIVSQWYLDKIGTTGLVGKLMEQNFIQDGAKYYLDGFYRINDVSSGVISAATDNAKEQIAGALKHDRLNLPIIQSAQLLLGYHFFTTMTLRRNLGVAALLEKLSIYDDEKLYRAQKSDEDYNDTTLLKALKEVNNVDELIAKVQQFKDFGKAPDFENLNTYNRNFLILLLSLSSFEDNGLKSKEFDGYVLAKFKKAKRFANFNRNLSTISNLVKGVDINFGEIKATVRAVHQAVNDKEFGELAVEMLNEPFMKAQLTDMIDDMNIGRTFFLQGQKIFDGLENIIEETVGGKFYREKEYSAFRNGFSAFILSKIIKNNPNFDKNFLIASTQEDLVNTLWLEVNDRFPNNLLLKALTTKNVQLLSEAERRIEEDETGELAEQSNLVPRRKIMSSIYGATEFKFFQTNTWAESNKFLTEKIQNEARRWNDMTINVTEIMGRLNKGETLLEIFDSTKDRFADDKLKAFFNAVLFYQSLYKDNLLFRNGSVATILDPRLFKIYGDSMGKVTNTFNDNDNAKVKELLGDDIIGVQREFLRRYLTSYDAYTLIPTLVSSSNDTTDKIITIEGDTLTVDLSEFSKKSSDFRNRIITQISENDEILTLDEMKKRNALLRAARLKELREGLKEAKSDIKLESELGYIVAKFPLIIKNVTFENGRNIITRYVLKEVKRAVYTDKLRFVPISGKAVSNILLKNTANLSPTSFTELMSSETKKQEVFGNVAVYVKVEVVGNKDIKQYVIGEGEWDDVVELQEEVGEENQLDSKKIYRNLPKKTESGNVLIKSVYQQKGIDYAKSIGGVFSLRVDNSTKHFGNPYTDDKSVAEKDKLVLVGSIQEAVEKYIDWILTDKYDYTHPLKTFDSQEFNDFYQKIKRMSGSNNTNEQEKFANNYLSDLLERKNWIRKQLDKGMLKGKAIVYYKELNQPSHANALDYLINNWETINQSAEANKMVKQNVVQKQINIYSGIGQNAELSNFAKRQFKYEGRVYQSVEHAYQTLKSGKFDESTYNRPNDFIGTKRNAPKNVNKAISSSLMKNLIRASFEQNADALQKLLSTGDSILTHIGGKDKFWEAEFPKLLMEIRNELSEKNSPKQEVPKVEVQKEVTQTNSNLKRGNIIQVEETEFPMKKEIDLSIYALRTAAINAGEGDINFKTIEAAYNAIKLFLLEGISASTVDVDAKIKELQQATTSQEISTIMKGIKYDEATFNADARDNMKTLIVDSFEKDKNVIEALMTQKLPEVVGFIGLMEEIRNEFTEKYNKQVKTDEDKKIAEEFRAIKKDNMMEDVFNLISANDIGGLTSLADSFENFALSMDIRKMINDKVSAYKIGEEIIRRCKG